MPRNQQPLSVIIPAAGMGRRMKTYGPKPLIDLGGDHTVLGRQISIVRRQHQDAEIVVVVGYEAENVMRHLRGRATPVENENYEHTNVLRSLGMGLRTASHDRVLIVYGDLVFNLAAIRIGGRESVAVVDNGGQMDDGEVGATVVDGRITRFSYGLPTKWCQIVYLTGRELELFRGVAWNRSNQKWYGFEGLNRVIELGGCIRAVEPKGCRIAEIDTAKDIDKARRMINR